ncbi:glycosyl transferase [Aureimonas flava]|uniref:Glycosyl transferase n=1 Tax=Aureimonas flava TaxID=2320271 RepID=A0A3A1WGM1_9HYPH|nr:glycosyltransferase family 2 protein [Aureimonas flava]RIX99546.1 glycosyl transferase [Aureimonas flava]
MVPAASLPDLDPFTLLFLAVQGLYALSLGLVFFFLLLPVNRAAAPPMGCEPSDADCPPIVLFYPVLRELEATMRTTFLSLSNLRYPADRYCVTAIPNANDLETVASLRRLALEFPFLRIVEVPPTSDPGWNAVWSAWDACPHAYWWHRGRRAGNRDLPPKKTRQLVYAFYTLAAERAGGEDFLVNYIDADSCPPSDHFMAAAEGMRHFDVLQAQNIAGNLNGGMAAALHAFDHMAWDGFVYPHLSADGAHPYWVLGKGLFFRGSDLVELGGFHPWITIEDPEVGMRFWTHGRRLGVIENPLIEEVPSTFAHGVTQRKRWICGFLQSLGRPLADMGMTWRQRMRARLNVLPCLSLVTNTFGLPIGAWTLFAWLDGRGTQPGWSVWLAVLNLSLFAILMSALYRSTWRRSALVLASRRARVLYLLRVNPLVLLGWWLFWTVPIAIGTWMFIRDHGLVWERTVKIDANHSLVRSAVVQPAVLRLGAPADPPLHANVNDQSDAGRPGLAL